MDPAAVPPPQELIAPAGWRTIEFISDLHLQAAEPATFEAWQRYMEGTRADAVFILGDLFEAWAGDDAAGEPGFDADCAAVLEEAAQRRDVLFMHGNRDFMVGAELLDQCGVTLLHDPTTLDFAGHRWLLTHGDQLCIEDVDYLRFRAQVRDPHWQRAMLAKPLLERRAMARALRERSEARHASGEPYADVDIGTAVEWMKAAAADVMIHGHTHRPADHRLPEGLSRIVLSDWDASARPARLECLRIDASGAKRIALT